VAENEVTIVWTSDVDAVSWVEVAQAGTNSFYSQEHPRYYETKNGNRVVGKFHKITISNLVEGTEYRYRVFSKAVLTHEGHRVLYGNIASTNVYRQKPLRFQTLNTQVGSDWHGPLDIRRKILPVLKNQGITAMICGHTHRYQYIEPQPEEFDFPIIINDVS
jgi:UDP-2,3-diacylglucosamine pyrophosphatase LpxH